MPAGRFKFTNGLNTFEKEFQAEDEAGAHAQVRAILKGNGCGLVQGSIRLGRKRLADRGPIFEPHLSPEEHMLAAEQNMRGALREYCFPDFRY
jgi:hypothetical protein